MASLPVVSLAQDESKSSIPLDHFYVKPRHGTNVFRRVLRNFHFGAFTGVGRTYFVNKLDGFGIYQTPNSSPELITLASDFRFTILFTNIGSDIMSTGNY